MERGLPRQGTQERENSLKEQFKTAALAVTNLYRTAAEGVSLEARKNGYDDALDDVMALLMEDEMTLERVRQWCLVRRRQVTVDSSEEDAPSTSPRRPVSQDQQHEACPRENPGESNPNATAFHVGTTTSARDSVPPSAVERRRRNKRRMALHDFFDMDISNKRRRRPHAH